MVRLAVCDDEQEMIDCISDKLRAHFPEKCEITAYVDGASLLSGHLKERFDAIFLDISMPGLNGMETAKKIRENDDRVKIIFVSNQNELAYKGYLYGAFRFVRKSNLDQELLEAATSLKEVLLFQNENIAFKTDTGYIVRAAEEIKYFEADGHLIYMACKDSTIRINGTLRDYEERLKNLGFIRIHKGVLVNFRYIRYIDKNAVILTCGKRLALSRNRITETKAKIKFFQEINYKHNLPV
ncbi:MAG: LytTR family DNA-binding domain-containing protein [Oscillospiraceae bacterium]|nr:LytTR family DNA-binding domain-containing protein [Oscillospiraceae bacterium]